MKYFLSIFMICFCLQLGAQAPQKQCSKEEFRAKKEAYLCKKAGLTEEEAEKFFPIYFELEDRRKEIYNKSWKNAKKGKNEDTTEKEYNDILYGFIDSNKEINKLDYDYMKRFQKILTNKKIYKVLRAEILFNRNMLKILHDK